MAWISKHCYHAKNNILICQLMSHKPKFFIGDSVQLRLSSTDTLPQVWKALELHSSQAQGCKSLEKTRIRVLQGCAPCGGCSEPGHPSSCFLSAGVQTLLSGCRSCRNSHAGSTCLHRQGRSSPGSQELPSTLREDFLPYIQSKSTIFHLKSALSAGDCHRCFNT